MQTTKEIYEPNLEANLQESLTPSDYKLISYYKQLKYGELTIIVRNGVPVKVHTALKTTLLVDASKVK